MKIVFVSNFLNHHQLPISEDFIKNIVDYNFIATEQLAEEQRNLGYEDMNKAYDFVIPTYDNEENYKIAMQKCTEADVVIIGTAPIGFVKQRIKQGKLTFIYTERIYKMGYKWYKLPIHFLRFVKKYYRKRNVYLLCSSAFTAADFAKTFTFFNKAYKWGYFPEVKKYDNIDEVISQKKKNTILWVGRIIDWKHTEKAVEVAKRLKADGYDFSLNIIGTGEKEEEIKALIAEYGLNDCVTMLGSMPPEKVREYMEQSEIFLFTSDRQEGWGAVLNESMNSGCAVVASHAIGSVPFLVKDGENGFIYKDSDIDDLYNKVKLLLDDPEKRKKMGANAYDTLITQWNAENAAKRFVELAGAIINGNKKPDIFADGVCSKAPLLKDNWYKND